MKLIKTTFQSGPKDEVIVEDIYKKDTSVPVNSYRDKEPEPIEPSEDLKKDEGDKNEKDKTLEENSEENNDSFSNDDMAGGDSDIKSCMSGMSDSLSSSFQGNDDGYKEDFSLGNESFDLNPSEFDFKDHASITQLTKILSSGNLNNRVQNDAARVKLISNTTLINGKMGRPPIFNEIIKNETQKVISKSLTKIVNKSITTGNFYALKDVVDSNYGKFVNSVNKNIATRIIPNIVKIPNIKTVNDKINIFKEIVRVFNKVEPTWLKNINLNANFIKSYNAIPTNINNTLYRNNNKINNYKTNNLSNQPSYFQNLAVNFINEKPLRTTFYGDDINGVIDHEFSDLNNDEIYNNIYKSSDNKDIIIQKWNEEKELRQVKKQLKIILATSVINKTNIKNKIKEFFPYL